MRLRSALQKAGAAAMLVGGLALAGPAHAQTPNYVGVTPPGLGAVDASTGSRTGAVDASTGSRTGAVEASTGSRTGAVLSTQGQVSPAQVSAQASSGRLAFTGSDVIGLATIGAASIGIGVIAVRSSRRRSAENTVDGAARAL